jgi:hypothetical protein
LAEIAFTATRMSRPFGSGLAVSKSIKASAASIGSDLVYPTAFIRRFSFVPRQQTPVFFRHYVQFRAPNCKYRRGNGCLLGTISEPESAPDGRAGAPITSIREPGCLYSDLQFLGNLS